MNYRTAGQPRGDIEFNPEPPVLDMSIFLSENRANLQWAIDRWNAEVSDRPLRNRKRGTLDGVWRQVTRHFGGDDEELLGPRHDDLLKTYYLKEITK